MNARPSKWWIAVGAVALFVGQLIGMRELAAAGVGIEVVFLLRWAWWQHHRHQRSGR